jgi:hypothetical protein
LTALVLAIGAGILVPLVRQALMEVLLLFSFSFTALACSFAALLMPSLRQWFLFQEVHTRIPMLPWGIDAWIIGWALIMEYAIGNITVAIS